MMLPSINFHRGQLEDMEEGVHAAAGRGWATIQRDSHRGVPQKRGFRVMNAMLWDA